MAESSSAKPQEEQKEKDERKENVGQQPAEANAGAAAASGEQGAMEVDDDPVQVDVSDELLAGMDDESKKTLRDKVNAAATEAAKKKARRTSPPTKSSGATASAGGGRRSVRARTAGSDAECCYGVRQGAAEWPGPCLGEVGRAVPGPRVGVTDFGATPRSRTRSACTMRTSRHGRGRRRTS